LSKRIPTLGVWRAVDAEILKEMAIAEAKRAQLDYERIVGSFHHVVK
jgi:hypothetical protein